MAANRAGCEITEISDGDRKAVSAMAAAASDQRDTEEQGATPRRSRRWPKADRPAPALSAPFGPFASDDLKSLRKGVINISLKTADNTSYAPGRGSCAGTVRKKGATGVPESFTGERGKRGIGDLLRRGCAWGILVARRALWVIAQLEGVSFQVLLEQLRHGTEPPASFAQPS